MTPICTVNAEAVDPKWETLALGRGLHTFDLDGGALWHREPWHHAEHVHPMHVQHVCRGVVE